jgi:hypothetical protein
MLVDRLYEHDAASATAIWDSITNNKVLILRKNSSASDKSLGVSLVTQQSLERNTRLTVESLERNARKETVYVEKRSFDDSNTNGSFGLGVRFSTTFGEFIKMLKNRETSESVYLSTQPIADDTKTGLPSALIAPPLSSSLSLFELRPVITEKLVPANINVWIGASRAGTSSGLHHDFHANLYTLLRGRKRFTVAAPSSYKAMYLYGDVIKLHNNGLINYKGFETLEDGRPVVHEEEEEVEEEEEEEEEDTAEVDAMWAAITDASFTKLNASVTTSATSRTSRKRVRPLLIKETTGKKSAKKEDTKTSAHPNHFSRIPLAELRSKVRSSSPTSLSPEEVLSRVQNLPEVKKNFPLFSKTMLYTFELKAGDCLFLPQGWFHEVESLGDDEGDIHMALNHWFWPPVSGSTREAPYGKEAGAFFEAAYKRAAKIHKKIKSRSLAT